MLKVRSFQFNPFQENTYVVYTPSGQCMIVDPGCYDRRERAELDAFISSEGLDVVLLVNTHCHIDHVFGNKHVADTYDLVLKIPRGEQVVFDSTPRVAEMYGLNYEPCNNYSFLEKELSLGGETLQVLEVPGHSPGHVAFYYPKGKILLAGDVLFRRSIGRTDLPGGDMHTLLSSIRDVLFQLPDNTKVYPGHMEPTTIGEEKVHNPFLKGPVSL